MDISKLINLQNVISIIVGGLITFLISFYFYRKKRLLLRYRLLSPISFQLPFDTGKTARQLRTQTLILKNSSRYAIDNIKIRLIKTQFPFPPESNLPSDRYSIREYEEDKFIDLTSLLVNEQAEFTFFLLDDESITDDNFSIASANAPPIRVEQVLTNDLLAWGSIALALIASVALITLIFLKDFIAGNAGNKDESIKEIMEAVKEREEEAFVSGRIISYVVTDKQLMDKLAKYFKNRGYHIRIHTIKAKDTLGNIAAHYNASIDAIKLANNIEGENTLMLRRFLIIPLQDDIQDDIQKEKN